MSGRGHYEKLINKPEIFIDEMLEGIYAAHGHALKCVDDDLKAMVRRQKTPGRVTLARAAAAAICPCFWGYVGAGMLDGCSVAGIFFLYKCAGAAADEMMDLDGVKRVAEKARENGRTGPDQRG